MALPSGTYSVFDTESIVDIVKRTLHEVFDTNEWASLLNTTVTIVETSQAEITSYPAVWAFVSGYIPTGALMARKKMHNTEFTLNVEVYTQIANDMTKEQINSKMRRQIHEALAENYGFSLTSATQVPSTNVGVERWRMTFGNTQDNFTKIIYK